jgi:hypothetical protein
MSYIGNVPVIPVDAITPITGSLSANGTLISVDTTGYNSISVQLTGNVFSSGASTMFEASNDNQNWFNVQGFSFNNAITPNDTVTGPDLYICPTPGRYFQVVVSNYVPGSNTSVSALAYLRSQSVAGYADMAMNQTLDDDTGLAQTVKFPGFVGAGNQSQVNGLPVTLTNEQIQDKYIVGRAFSGNIPVNTILTNDTSIPTQQGWIDCSQYRSLAVFVNQSATATAGTITFEFSNDGVNLLNPVVGLFDTQGVDSLSFVSSVSSSLSTTGAKTITRFGNIVWKYFRIRVTSAITSTSSIVQATVMLRMTTSPVSIIPQANIGGINNGTFPTQTTGALNNAINTTNLTTAYLPIGGDDKSVINPQIQGAPYPIASTNASYVTGPFYRRNYVDFAGGVGVAGLDPRYSEDKTYPVNVRLERTTAGQESVQDILAQILVELKAMNYYTRELPVAVGQVLQGANPNATYPTAMQDELENFFHDPNILNSKNG